MSIDRIFEFPREKRRVKRVKRFAIANDPEQFPVDEVASCGQVGGLICSDWGAIPTSSGSAPALAQLYARQFAVGRTLADSLAWTLDWQTNIIRRPGDADSAATPSLAQWQELLTAGAARACRARGGKYVAGSGEFGPGHNNNKGLNGDNLGWFYGPNLEMGSDYKYQARQSRTWTATCKKTIRRTRK